MQTLTPTDELRKTHLEELHIAAGKIENAMEDRDMAIWEAVKDGLPVAEIAREVGLTRQRVYQIATKNSVGPMHTS